MKRYLVCGYGWEGIDLDEALEIGTYFDTVEEAIEEYERLCEEELACDEGALAYDTEADIIIMGGF